MLNRMCSDGSGGAANAAVRNRHGSLAPWYGRERRCRWVTAGATCCSTQTDHADRDDRRSVTTGRPCGDRAAERRCAAVRTVLRRSRDAVDALDADRGRPLALGTDRPAAALAAHVGHPVGVARADRCRLLLRVSPWVSRHCVVLARTRAGGSPSVVDGDRLDDDVLDGLVAAHRWARRRSCRRPHGSDRRRPRRRSCACPAARWWGRR